MSRAQLIVDPASVRAGSAGPATGVIWLALDGLAFPVEGWNDFIVVILEAWVNAVLRLLNRDSSGEIVHFMDGPFLVELSLISTAVLRLRAIENGRNERAFLDVDALPLVESLVRGSEGVLASCRDKHCWSVDVEKLAASLPLLRRQVVQLSN